MKVVSFCHGKLVMWLVIHLAKDFLWNFLDAWMLPMGCSTMDKTSMLIYFSLEFGLEISLCLWFWGFGDKLSLCLHFAHGPVIVLACFEIWESLFGEFLWTYSNELSLQELWNFYWMWTSQCFEIGYWGTIWLWLTLCL